MDLLINSWFKNRGRKFEWDTVIVVHWDQLILAPIKELFPRYKKGEMILPGLRPVSEVENWWSWLSKANTIYGYAHYQDFLRYVKKEYGYNGDPLCFQGLLCFVPREFLEKFSRVPEIEHGYIEYRMAVYAQIFKTPFCASHTVDCWWPTDPDQGKYTEHHKCMHASKKEIGLKTILRLQKEKDGQRLFHPYRRLYPLSVLDWAKLVKDKFSKPGGEGKHLSIKRDI